MKRTWNLLDAGLTFGIVVALLSGCAGTASVTQPAAMPEAKTKSAVKAVIEPEMRSLSGKVVETMNSGGYTYVNLEKDGKKSWFALPFTKVDVGQEIEVQPGTQMGKFSSKTLNRTFEDIMFSVGLVNDTKKSLGSTPLGKAAASSLPSGHPPMDGKPQIDKGLPASDAKSQGHMGRMDQSDSGLTAVSGKVVETMDSGGYTYVCLENGGKKVWVAVPTMKVSVGQELKLRSGQEMTNFKSKSLNRTFDSVIFSAGPLPATN
jgi:hypothetical protein